MPRKGKGEIVSMAALASLFGVHRDTVAAWAKKGCPFVQKADRGRGQEWQFNTADVSAWRIEQAQQDVIGETGFASKDELERRKLAAETTLSELKAAQGRGELGAIEEFEKQTENLLVEIRQRLLQIPARVATVIVATESEHDVKEILGDEITQALTAIADDYGDD